MLETEGVDLIFIPNLVTYPLGTDVGTKFTVPQISEILW